MAKILVEEINLGALGTRKLSFKDDTPTVRTKITNADRIRAYTDEELAEWLTKITDDAQSDARTKCDYQWAEWLKSEAKEEK